ncbi:hypothetical protein P154DRAFT_138922 [Amniculicola lignicola CBS 123094]|uniref:RBR-type E3 ubiquitin transferase n=1 Tax=Amniculicola lignicola CBS 123094 TaxID=1392246 RepID=A0A6A5WLN9_9PLEO|nr:hypothetical protein P154DRAFT_138922 [Amniculicola lignicola CBS 123094]
MADSQRFPPKCCLNETYSLPLVQHLLGKDAVIAFKTRLIETQTVEQLKVYCVNPNCGRFLHQSTFDNANQLYTIARCKSCNTNTCVGCKMEWFPRSHRCELESDLSKRTAWLPEYTPTCRIKRCPKCHGVTEHMEACNHMTCVYCKHEYCFVCLIP